MQSKELFHRLAFWNDRTPRTACLQMALDEALLNPEILQIPLLRHYTWKSRAASFGFSGSLRKAKAEAADRELVRRWTGGGIVLHDSDWTFSLIVPQGENFLQLPIRESYAHLHRVIAETLVTLGLAARLAALGEEKQAEACFRGLACHDVLNQRGEKICGGAQRRHKNGLLHQGSLQIEKVPDDFLLQLGSRLSTRLEPWSPNDHIHQLASEIAKRRYASTSWLERVA